MYVYRNYKYSSTHRYTRAREHIYKYKAHKDLLLILQERLFNHSHASCASGFRIYPPYIYIVADVLVLNIYKHIHTIPIIIIRPPPHPPTIHIYAYMYACVCVYPGKHIFFSTKLLGGGAGVALFSITLVTHNAYPVLIARD